MSIAASRAICLRSIARGLCASVLVACDDRARRTERAPLPAARNAPERRQVGLHDEVAVALLPIGHGVARHRLHIDVVGEQIVAAVGFLDRRRRGNTRPESACRPACPACRGSRPRPCRSRRRRRPACSSFNVNMPGMRRDALLSKEVPARSKTGRLGWKFGVARRYTLTAPSRCFTANASSGEKTSVFRP